MTDLGLAGRAVLLSGGTSAAGRAVARRLADGGARVVVAGRDPVKLAALGREGVATIEADLADEDEVAALAAALGPVDGVLHLVGGWRGGGGILGQTEADYRALEGSFTALRLVTRALWPSLVASPCARVAMVSSTAVARPLAGGANYAAVKAASEAWMRALAHGFAKEAPAAAATIFRVTALAGLEERLAEEYAALWQAPADAVDDRVIDLS
ncbi:SDR family NAD(P)-dependent oxidoreductase [Microbacterium sp. NPDC055683]